MAERTEIHLVLTPGTSAIPANVQELADSFDAELTPQFPGVDDPILKIHWLAQTPRDRAQALTDALLALPEIDGAYVKPAESAP